jgi:hypothetical protein
MKYYKYVEPDNYPYGGTTYLETEEGWAIRQITVSDDQYYASNGNYSEFGLILSEGYVDYDSIDEVAAISQQEFEYVWQAHLRQHNEEWELAKQRYSVGTPVRGTIRIFYPQGVIVELGENVLGVADYAACRSTARPEWMSSNHILTAVVAGYDETNQWIVLTNPQVHAERVGRGDRSAFMRILEKAGNDEPVREGDELPEGL